MLHHLTRTTMKRHLQTLSILHYVYGAFVCMSGFVALVFIFLGLFLSSDWLMENNDGEAVPRWIGGLFQTFGWVIFVVIEVWGVLNLLSGYWIARRRNRTGTQVIAAFNCLNIPFGIALGIFTFVLMADDEVKTEYGALPRTIVA